MWGTDCSSSKLDPVGISKLGKIVAHEDFQSSSDGTRVMAVGTSTEVSCNCCPGVICQNIGVHGLGITCK